MADDAHAGNCSFVIYHLTSPSEWKAAAEVGAYRAESLLSEGFIHCSYQEQVLGSADRHFAGHQDLVVLHLSEEALDGLIRVEPAGNGVLFPHVYGPIPQEAVVSVSRARRGEDGHFRFSD